MSPKRQGQLDWPATLLVTKYAHRVTSDSLTPASGTAPVPLQFLTSGNMKLGKLIFITPAKLHLEHQTRQRHFLESVITVSPVVLNTPRHKIQGEFCFVKWEREKAEGFTFPFYFIFHTRSLFKLVRENSSSRTTLRWISIACCPVSFLQGKKKSNRFSRRTDFVE